jgi:hypothetical protein
VGLPEMEKRFFEVRREGKSMDCDGRESLQNLIIRELLFVRNCCVLRLKAGKERYGTAFDSENCWKRVIDREKLKRNETQKKSNG